MVASMPKGASGLAVAGVVALIAISAACTSASPAPTVSEPPTVTVTNVRILTPTPAPSPPPASTPGQPLGDVSRGQVIYAQQCAACHGSAGEGGIGPALNTDEFAQEFADDAALTAVVRTGRGVMPAYGSNRLTDQAMADLIAYMRSLAKSP